MSAGNYMLVRRVGEQYGVTMQFASNEGESFDAEILVDTLEEAISIVDAQLILEYGVWYEEGVLE